MTKLIVRHRGQVISEVVLDPLKSWIVGRKTDANIVLDGDKGISREHFRIFEDNGVWQLEVLSKLGNVTSNGESITSIVLNPGYKFELSTYEFEVALVESTLAITNAQGHTASSGDDVSLSDRTVVQTSNLTAYIKIMNEDGDVQQKIKLDGGDTWVAGRDVNTEILISDHRVSRRQFEIHKSGLGYEIVDQGSVNGTFVNEKVLEPSEPVILKSGDIIRVLDHTLIFEVLDPHFFDRIENLPALNNSQPSQMQDPHYLPMEHQHMEGLSADSEEGGDAVDPAAARTKKIRIALVSIIVVGALFYLLSNNKGSTNNLSNVAPSGADPLSGLTPQQRSEYKQSLELAKRYHMEGNYSLALSEVEELAKKFNVKDPELERVRNTAQAAIESQKLLIRQEKEAKEKEAMEKKIQDITGKCSQNLERFTSEEDLDNCLVDALQLNPTHPAILDLKTRMQGLLTEREVNRQKREEYEKRVRVLHSLYSEAQKSEKENDYVRTLAAYRKVINSSLPDPSRLKPASEKRLAQLKIEMDKKIKEYIDQADAHQKKNELKEAILVLREAVKIDPTRMDLKERAEEYKKELRKQMMVLYQEGILEENFGNVEGGDNRPGAKDKWKKIIQLDVPDGEYYHKAYLKLKKYGAN